MRKLLWNVYFWSVFTLLTITGLVVLPFILVVNVLFLSRTMASGLRRAIRFYGWVLVCLVPYQAPVQVEYRSDGLPPSAIFVANHNSAIDPYVFGAISVENSFVTSWPFKIPVYGFIMRLAGYANIGNGWEEVRRKCEELLKAGSYVTIWPEGHRSRDTRLGRFKNGAFSLAVATGRPVIPVCILGAAEVLPPGKRLLSCGQVKLIVLEPVYPLNCEENMVSAVRRLRQEVRAVIEETLKDNGHFRST